VANFLKYVDDGFYDGTIFHRVMKGFMIQGGGFTQDMGKKSTRPPVPYEGNNGLYNDRGTIAMARTQNANSATSQFFINQVTNPFLNHGARGGAGYTVFGDVIQGMDIIDNIADVSTHNVGPYSNVPKSPVIIEKVVRVK
jgi:Peptidyl-prolyl cis-trans isomerase (rotamase) - cyclophilin family